MQVRLSGSLYCSQPSGIALSTCAGQACYTETSYLSDEVLGGCLHSLHLTDSSSLQTQKRGAINASFPQFPLRSEESRGLFKDLSESNMISLLWPLCHQHCQLYLPSLLQAETYLNGEFQEETISGSRAGLVFYLKLEQSGWNTLINILLIFLA